MSITTTHVERITETTEVHDVRIVEQLRDGTISGWLFEMHCDLCDQVEILEHRDHAIRAADQHVCGVERDDPFLAGTIGAEL